MDVIERTGERARVTHTQGKGSKMETIDKTDSEWIANAAIKIVGGWANLFADQETLESTAATYADMAVSMAGRILAVSRTVKASDFYKEDESDRVRDERRIT